MKEIFKIDFLKSFHWKENIKELALFVLTVVLLSVVMTSFRENTTVSQIAKGELARETIKSPISFVLQQEDKKAISVLKGEVIVRDGEVLNSLQEQKLRHIKALESERSALWYIFAYSLISSALLLFVYLFPMYFWPGFRHSIKDLSVVSSILVLSFLLVKLAALMSTYFPNVDSGIFLLAMPLAAGGLLLQVTLGATSVFLFTLCFGLLSSIFIKDSGLLLLLIFSGNIIGALSMQRCSKRSAFFVAGLRIGLINALLVIAFTMLYPDHGAGTVFSRILFSFLSGLFSSVLATGLTPLLEFVGGYVTDIKLLELASIERPLLRELSIEAPGTWNHSIIMGQMAEAGAEAIGANGLLARVGAYYHDIGKMKKPEYFVENQSGKENKHDKLAPSMSALIIKSHVKDGIEMAKQHRLPTPLIDFIAQHHGTSLVEYFYKKAIDEAGEGDEVSENHYRYPGPKPESKEAVILMLADQIEASSRTMGDPTPAKIQGMVQKTINRVFSSNELEASNLTLNDLHLIARSFTRVLNGIFHRRVEYAESVEKGKEKEKAKEKEEVNKQEEKQDADNRSKSENGSEKGDQGSSSKKQSSKDSKEALKRLGI